MSNMKALVIVFKMLDERRNRYGHDSGKGLSKKHFFPEAPYASLQIMDFSGSEIFACHLDL